MEYRRPNTFNCDMRLDCLAQNQKQQFELKCQDFPNGYN